MGTEKLEQPSKYGARLESDEGPKLNWEEFPDELSTRIFSELSFEMLLTFTMRLCMVMKRQR